MKKIIRPKQHEEARYFSDFSNQSFGVYEPEVKIEFDFNYGSKFDTETLEFHLTDDEAAYVLDFIKTNLSNQRLEQIRNGKEKLFFENL